MGDMADDFRAMREYQLEQRAKVEPTRFEYAVDKLMQAGHSVARNPEDDKCIIVDGAIRLWPYTGWYSGKGIGSGRGIRNLIKKLEEIKI